MGGAARRAPDLPPTTRPALHTEAPVRQVDTGRTALVLPAGDAAPTPPAGVRVDVPGARLRLAVHGGLWAFSVLRWRPLDLGDVDLLLAQRGGGPPHRGAAGLTGPGSHLRSRVPGPRDRDLRPVPGAPQRP